MTPPYASDTRAKGWRFELDYEQIEQSSTWALASAEAKPWLLMLWFTAWKQVPCGSLPADEQVIAALIGIAPKAWEKHSKVLLRGWAEVGGRLYHDTLAKRVQEMMARRRSDSDRKAAQRARDAAESVRKALDSAATHAGITPESRVTTAGFHPESSTGTDNLLPQEKPPSGVQGARRALKNCPPEFLVTSELQAWARENVPLVDIRAETAIFRATERKTAITDWPKAWQKWMLVEQKKLIAQQAGSETNYARQMRERVAEIHPALARPAPGQSKQNPMEVLDGLTNVARIAG